MNEQRIVFPPAVRTAYEFTTAQLHTITEYADVNAYGKVPPTRPDRFVRFRRAGGAQIDLVTTEPLILAESFALSDEDAEALAEVVHSIWMAGGRAGHLGTVPVRQVRAVSLPQSLPDLSGQPRYSAMYAPQLRGRVA